MIGLFRYIFFGKIGENYTINQINVIKYVKYIFYESRMSRYERKKCFVLQMFLHHVNVLISWFLPEVALSIRRKEIINAQILLLFWLTFNKHDSFYFDIICRMLSAVSLQGFWNPKFSHHLRRPITCRRCVNICLIVEVVELALWRQKEMKIN